MPMDFPDMASLIDAADVHQFRAPLEGEAEKDYREALANHVRPRDMIESMEIRNSVGWDRWSDEQNRDMLKRAGITDLIGGRR